MTNPYDAVVAELPKPEELERQRTVSASQALVDGGHVAAQAPAAAPPPNWAEVTRGLPATQQLLADPATAVRVKDDVVGLSALEYLFRGWKDVAWETSAAWKRGRASERLGQIGYLQATGRGTPELAAEADRLEAQVEAMRPVDQGLVAGIPAAVAESAPMMLGTAARSGREVSVGAGAGVVAGALAGAPAGGVGAIPGAATGLLSGAGLGLKVGMTAETAKLEKGLAFREYMAIPGVTPEAAATAATFVGVANGFLEVLPLDLVLQVPGIKAVLAGQATKDVFRRVLGTATGRAAVARAAARLAGGVTVEGLTEAAQELSTVLGGQAAQGQVLGLEGVDWGRVVEAGVRGAQGGAGMGAVGVAGGLQADLGEARAARQRAAFWTELGTAAGASSTVAQQKDVAHAYIAAVQAEHGGGPVTEVSVPAEALLQLFQQDEITLEQVAQRMPAVAKQLEEAAGNPGVEVTIPTADLAVHVAPSKGYAALVPDIRVGNELTLREAEQVEKEAAALAEEDAKREGAEAEPAPEQRVVADVAAKLEAAGQAPENARVAATLWGAFAKTMAARTGAPDAWAFYERLGVQVDSSALPPGAKPGELVAAQPPAREGARVRGQVVFPESREWFKVTLTGAANLSTFLHESGHVFLEVLRGYADVNEALAADLKAVHDWTGVPIGGDFTQAQLEQFARGFESYLREGKAPSGAIEGVFEAVRSWLEFVYRALRGLNVELTDEVRDVMDRMLASRAEIARAREAAGLAPAFESAEQAGMTEAAFQAYRARWDAAARAVQGKVERRTLAALRRTMGEERARIRADVEHEAEGHQVFNLRAFLRTGDRLDGAAVPAEIAGKRLNRFSVDGLADAGEMRRLSRFFAEEEGEGIDSVDLAPYFGFDDAHAMVRALVETPRRAAWVKAEVERRMAEKYPDSAVAAVGKMAAEEVRAADGLTSALVDELGAAQRQVLRVVRDEQRKATRRIGALEGKLETAEAKAAALKEEQRGAEREAAEGWKLATRSARRHAEVLKAAVRQRVAGMVAFEMRPDRYQRAEKQAAAAFVKAIRKGEYQAAYDAKVLQLWNHLMAAEVGRARDELERIRAYAAGFDDVRTRRRIGKVDPSYLDAIDVIREGVQFKRESFTAASRRYSLAKWISEREAAGDVVAPALKALSELKSYQEMTLEELRGVEAALSNVEAMAKLKGKLRHNKELRDLARTAHELAEGIRANLGATKGPTPGEKPLEERVRSWFRGGDAAIKKVEFLVRELDGGQTAGPAHQLIFQPLVDAQNARYDLQDQVYGALMKPFEGLDAARRRRYAQKVGFLYSPKFGKMVMLTRRDVLAVVLNLGNDGNRERLLAGYGWTEAEVRARLGQLLDAGDVAIVEHVWRTVDSLWPKIAELHERHAGLKPGRVEATPFRLVLADGTEAALSGGYYPIVKASDLSDVGRNLAEIEESKSLWTANFFAPVVEHGFTQARGKDLSALELSLDVVPRHLDKVIHYLTHYEAIRGVDRLLQVPELRQAITEGVGREYLQELRPWLEAIAADGAATDPIAWWSRALRHLRFGTSIVMLFGKIPTGLKQGLGLLTSAKEVRRRHLVAGVRRFLAEGWVEVVRESGEFRHLDKQLDRDARELFTSLQGRFSDLGRAKAQVIEWGAMPIMLVQKSVNAITWYAAREQAFEEGHPDPVAYADSIVRITQTGGGVKDLAAIQRGGEAFKMLTVMFSYRSVLYNLLTEKTGRRAKGAEVFARVWWALLMPVVVEQLLMRGVKDDEDPEDVAKRLAVEFALLPASTVPVLGDVAEAGLEDRRMSAAPWLETLAKGLDSAKDVVAGDGDVRDAKQLAETVGVILHLPTSALFNYGDYLARLVQGELEEPVQDLLFRSPSQWE